MLILDYLLDFLNLFWVVTEAGRLEVLHDPMSLLSDSYFLIFRLN